MDFARNSHFLLRQDRRRERLRGGTGGVRASVASNDIDIGKAEPLYARQLRILERSIQSRRLGVGTVLIEGPLAAIFSSSRQPVRRALAQLHEIGLVHRFDGRGYVVGPEGSTISRSEITADMLELGSDVKALRKHFAWEIIYEVVERTIIHCSVFGRFRVNELELARQFNVGRTVARDVMTRLLSLGMIEKDSRQRWITIPLDEERVANLYEIRGQLEPLALQRALPEIDAKLLRQMRSRLDEAIASYPDVTPAQMDDLEFDLHIRCLMRCPNKEMLSALLRTRCVLTLSKHVLGSEVALPPKDPFMSEHHAIFDAMLAGNEKRTRVTLERHLASACPKVVDRLRNFRQTRTPPSDATYISVMPS
jgi:DNA-binding GntR family transcriptional regulator